MLLNQCVVVFCFVLCDRNVVQFSSNVHVSFVLCHVQFLVFFIFSNFLQVLVMYINLLVYLIVFVFIGRVFIIWYFVVHFFVFANFNNILQVFLMYFDLQVYLFVFVFVVLILVMFIVSWLKLRSVIG